MDGPLSPEIIMRNRRRRRRHPNPYLSWLFEVDAALATQHGIDSRDLSVDWRSEYKAGFSPQELIDQIVSDFGWYGDSE